MPKPDHIVIEYDETSCVIRRNDEEVHGPAAAAKIFGMLLENGQESEIPVPEEAWAKFKHLLAEIEAEEADEEPGSC